MKGEIHMDKVSWILLLLLYIQRVNRDGCYRGERDETFWEG